MKYICVSQDCFGSQLSGDGNVDCSQLVSNLFEPSTILGTWDRSSMKGLLKIWNMEITAAGWWCRQMPWGQWATSLSLPRSAAQNFPLAATEKRVIVKKALDEFVTCRIASPFLRQSRPVFNLCLISLGFAPLPGPACNILQWCFQTRLQAKESCW